LVSYQVCHMPVIRMRSHRIAPSPSATTTNHPNRLNKSRGQRVVWLLEELGLEYDIAVHKRDENKRAGPELKAIHPLGKSPCVTIRPANSEKEIVIAESETIMEYICDHFGKELVPKRYPEGQEGVLGAETEEWMRYKVRHILLMSAIQRRSAYAHRCKGELFPINVG